MAKRLKPATMGGARIVAKADRLATPSIAQAAADCDRAPLRFDLIGCDAAAFEHGGERVVIRRKRGGPLCAAARAALAPGVDPVRPVAVFRDGRPALIVRGSLAALARLDVREDGRGLRLVGWRPFAGGRADD
jgi:hypothetical protein